MEWTRYKVTTKGSVSVVRRVGKSHNYPIVRGTSWGRSAQVDEPAARKPAKTAKPVRKQKEDKPDQKKKRKPR